jgi:hypothetical protein
MISMKNRGLERPDDATAPWLKQAGLRAELP